MQEESSLAFKGTRFDTPGLKERIVPIQRV